jgi:hypothetical protein
MRPVRYADGLILASIPELEPGVAEQLKTKVQAINPKCEIFHIGSV